MKDGGGRAAQGRATRRQQRRRRELTYCSPASGGDSDSDPDWQLGMSPNSKHMKKGACCTRGCGTMGTNREHCLF